MFMHFSKPQKIKDDLKKIGFNLIFSEFRGIIEKKRKPNLTKDYFYVCQTGDHNRGGKPGADGGQRGLGNKC